jgi:hypothetical protein
VLDFAGMTENDLAALRRAVALLEHPGFAARLANMVGKPIELIGYALPASASQAITTATSKALEMALAAALRTMHHPPRAGSQLFHKALVTASGAAGGAFGLATLPIELPVSTIIMLRSIADIARSAGEDLSDPEAALSCVQVFALGGRPDSAGASESGYFAVRSMLAKSVTQAARFVVERGVIEEGGPILCALSPRSHPASEWWSRRSSRLKPFRSSVRSAALASITRSSSISRRWLKVTLPFGAWSARMAKRPSGRSTSASHSTNALKDAHIATVTLRFSPRSGSSPVNQALANSKTVRAVRAAP